ncbi:MAG TPA: hypothetical protein VIK98_04060 [Limnochordales bacterium]
MSVLMIFVDGLGLGDDDPAKNPLVTAPMPNLRGLLGGAPLARTVIPGDGQPYEGDVATLVAVDSCLGVPGLPQSATGQTTMLSGVNAAAMLGRHLSGLPTPTLVDILRRHSLFKQLVEAGRRATFANPFTPEYFEAVNSGRWRHSATTTAVLSAGLPVRMLADLQAGRAVFHDVTGETLRERGYDVALVSPREAGRRLARLAREHDFVLFEHFLTDKAGHAQDWESARHWLGVLDEFLGGVLDAVDLDRTLVMLISDHGNVEDLSVRTHTQNPVPALLIGRGRAQAAAGLASLVDVTPVILALLAGEGGTACG